MRLRLNWPHSDMMSVDVTTDWRNLVPMAHAGLVWVRPMLEGVQANEGYAGKGTSGTVVAPLRASPRGRRGSRRAREYCQKRRTRLESEASSARRLQSSTG